MKILIAGASGMLGHQLWRKLHERHEVIIAMRRPPCDFFKYDIFKDAQYYPCIDATDETSIHEMLDAVKPDALINCIGVIKQRSEASDPILCIKINALLPHLLASACKTTGTRLIQISTDCVFDGRKGHYTEDDVSNAQDLYGRTKYLGEIQDNTGLTLRTSLIGHELGTRNGLIEWFLSNRNGKVKGYTNAIYTGLTTNEFGCVIEKVLLNFPKLSGLWHVSSAPISKLELLELVNKTYKSSISIEPETSIAIDRSLDSTRFRNATGYAPPTWKAMIETMAAQAE